MRFVSVRDLRGKSKEIWRELLSEKDMVVTSNGRPIAILSQVSEGTLEGYLAAVRKARAIQAVEIMQTQSAKAGRSRMAPDEVAAEIRAVRKRRSK